MVSSEVTGRITTGWPWARWPLGRPPDLHLRNVYTKLGITSRTELAALALDPV